jgi:hypothetical protein
MGKHAFPVKVAVSATAGLTAALGLLGSAEDARATVITGDTFSIAVVGFNGTTSTAAGAYLTTPTTFDPAFGAISTYPGDALGGQTLTISSTETVGAVNTVDTITVSVPTNFAPTGTKIGTRYVAAIDLNIGGYNAFVPGSTTAYDTLDFNQAPLTPVGTGSIIYGAGTVFPLTPTDTFTNGGTSLEMAEGVNDGTGASQSSSIEGINVTTISFSLTYPNDIPVLVPEPSSKGIMGFAGLVFGSAALFFRRRRA